MMIPAEPASVSSDQAGPLPDQLRLAVTAYLARFKGSSRGHSESDLRCYLTWCADHGLDPLAVQRFHLELYVRWMQETLGFTHLQFEALLTAARQSPDPCDWALVTMLGLLGLRIFEATSTDIADLARSTATGCCA
jgi:integrase